MQCDIDCHTQDYEKIKNIRAPMIYKQNNKGELKLLPQIGFLHVTRWVNPTKGRTFYYGRIHGERSNYATDVKYILSMEDAQLLNASDVNSGYHYMMGEESSRFAEMVHLISMSTYEAQVQGYNMLVIGEVSDNMPLEIAYGPAGSGIMNAEYKAWDIYYNDPTCGHHADYIAARWRAIGKSYGFLRQDGSWAVNP